jgi:KDO II ethanolaminephosphotransferase
MGETARSDKFGINGYTRDTTPLLSKLQNQIITFKDVKSCRTVTTHSVLCLTTPHTFYNYDFIPEMGSFFDVFNSNDQNKTKHFKTHVYSMQTISWLYRIFKPDYVKTQYAMHNLNFASIFLDSDLLDDLDPILKLDTSDFIFLHTYGSHYNYILRYPKEFEKFKPICDKYPMSRCSKEQIVNAYDNTIFYTDYIISEVIRRLKDENAILFYVSDHGEKLGEHGSYLHGTRGGEKIYDYEVKVPMIMWASKKFLSDPENKKKFENAKKFVNVPISHDNIFHTVLGCSGFVSNNGGIDENLNLCSAKSAKDAKRKY